MKKQNIHLYLLISIQLVLICIGFQKFLFNGTESAFKADYDGMKNYFTYHAYIQQEQSEDLFLFEQMNYPFGDYVPFTDNIPPLAVSVKWFSEHVYDVKAYDFQILHWFLCLSLVFSSFLLFKIGNRFFHHKWLLLIICLTLPWISPQIRRLEIGHLSLSLSWCVLLVMYGLLKWYEAYNESLKKTLLPLLALIVAMVFTAMFHTYYLLINGLLVAYFSLFWAISQRKNWKKSIQILSSALVVGLASLLTFMALLRSFDAYYELRKETAEGFNYHPWQLTFDGIFNDYFLMTIPSVFKTNASIHYESYAYLGSAAIYGFIFFIVLFFIKKGKKERWNRYFNTSSYAPFIKALCLSGIACLFVGFGSMVHCFNDALVFDNWLSPFYYIENLVPRIQQFRCLGRMVWVFFFAFNIGLFYLLDQFIKDIKIKRWKYLPLLVLCTFLTVDMSDFVKYYRAMNIDQALTLSPNFEKIERLFEGLDTKKYQALLPIPYVHVGSENYDYTLDPEDKWMTTQYQLSEHSQLPLMSCVMSRTALEQAYALVGLFLEEELSPLLAKNLTDKPILVVLEEKESAWTVMSGREPAKTAQINGKTWVQKKGLLPIKQVDTWTLYEWFPK